MSLWFSKPIINFISQYHPRVSRFLYPPNRKALNPQISVCAQHFTHKGGFCSIDLWWILSSTIAVIVRSNNIQGILPRILQTRHGHTSLNHREVSFLKLVRALKRTQQETRETTSVPYLWRNNSQERKPMRNETSGIGGYVSWVGIKEK